MRFARVHDVISANALVINATTRVVKGSDLSEASGAELREFTDRLVTEAIGDADPALRSAYGQLLGLGVHDISAMRELLGMPRGVLFAAHRQGGCAITAAFDYGDFICQYETTTDDIPRYDTTLEVYTSGAVLRVEYDTPYVLNLPIRLRVLQVGGGGSGVSERVELPTWGDAFKLEWQAFYENITQGRTPKTSPQDFRQDLELFVAMIEKMRG